MSEELAKRIGDAYLLSNYVDGQTLLHTDLNQMNSIIKTAINENYFDIQKLQNGELKVKEAEVFNGATLAKFTEGTLQNDDNTVPTSQQVKQYIDERLAAQTFSL